MKKILFGLIASLFLATPTQAELINNSSTTHPPMDVDLMNTYWFVAPKVETSRIKYKLASACYDKQFTVKTSFIANEQGEMTNIQIVQSSGNPTVDKEVLRAVRQAKLRPLIHNGKPIRSKVILPFLIIIPKLELDDYDCSQENLTTESSV